MASPTLMSKVALLLTITTAVLAQDAITIIEPTLSIPKGCPTITVTSQHPAAYCPVAPPICITPACVKLSSISVPCGCPTTVPTYTSYLPCTARCTGGCGTYYSTVLPTTKCTTTKRTSTKPFTTTIRRTTTPATITTTAPWTTITKPPVSSCDTITVTTGSDCPKTPTTCSYVPDCILLSSVTSRCGCTGVVEKTACRTTCVQGCLTQFQTVTEKCAVTGGPVTLTWPTLAASQ